MSEKQIGEKVEDMDHTFRRDQKDRALQLITFPASSNLEKNSEYFVSLSAKGATDIDYESVDPFVVKTHTDNRSFSIPREIINQLGIQAGDHVRINFYDVTEPEMQIDNNSSVIDRIEVRKDKYTPDNCDSALTSKAVCEYLGEDEKKVKLRNVSKNKETEAFIKQTPADNTRISFIKRLRKRLNTSPGDLIEVIGPNEEQTETAGDTETHEYDEKIDEMYEMVSELYEAYTAAKND